MRQAMRWIGSALGLALLAGCGAELPLPAGSSPDVGRTGGTSSAQTTAASAPTTTVVSGALSEGTDYQLVDLGSAEPGEAVRIALRGGVLNRDTFLVVLLDENQDLLQRQVVSSGAALEHFLRASTETLFLGVAPAPGRTATTFAFDVERTLGAGVPLPRATAVWLNFAGGVDVVVHGRAGITFPMFDATSCGPGYAGTTDALKRAIVTAVQEDYAPYNVTVLSSDDGPPPAVPHATLHFGGSDPRLLGLADSVDRYNEDEWQVAMVYVNGFADFATMQLSVDEMGQMVGNVASHEVGHLLGLFHTRTPTDVMDTTGTAWDLVADQAFERAALEPSVFPLGFEDSPTRLAETVGRSEQAKNADAARPRSNLTSGRKLELRAMVRAELPTRCGNCAHPDD